MKRTIGIVITLFLFAGCSAVQYRDVNEDSGSREWGPKEIKVTVGKMVGSMYSFLKNEWKKASFIEVKRFRNKTSEHIDTKMISDPIDERDLIIG